jgi:hypothetical protein
VTYRSAADCADIDAAIEAAFATVTGRRVEIIRDTDHARGRERADRKQEIVARLQSGEPYKVVAAAFDVSRQRISQIAIAAGIRRKRRPE